MVFFFLVFFGCLLWQFQTNSWLIPFTRIYEQLYYFLWTLTLESLLRGELTMFIFLVFFLSYLLWQVQTKSWITMEQDNMVKNLSDSWISTRSQVGFGQFWLLPHPCSGLTPSLFGVVMGGASTKTMLCKRGVLGPIFLWQWKWRKLLLVNHLWTRPRLGLL